MPTTIEILPRDAANQTLLANVHPADWVNPELAPRYNLVVIGGGTAGLVSAAGAAALGAKVALVERDLLGGDCLNAGCVPSKALIASARAAAALRDTERFGIRVPPGAEVDFAAVMERMRRLRAGISPHDSAARFRDLGVDVFLGNACFTGPDAVEVGGQTLRFHRAVIATGARPARPPIPGLAETGYLTNEDVFTLTERPRRLAVLGAGPLGCELAQAFARLGSTVALLDVMPTIMPREDGDATELVRQSLERDGVTLLLGHSVERVEKQGTDKVLHVQGGAEVRADEILVGVGRIANVENLGLEAAGVRYDKKGVTVDDRLRTTNARIYAAGDVCSPYQFTHAADAMARLVLQNALFPGRAKVSALTIPWCTYTDPEVAHVGLYPHEADAKGIALETLKEEMREVDRAVLDGDGEGFVKVHVKKRTDRILGATIVARQAGEMIGLVTLAMTAGLGLKSLSRTIYPYPTRMEALRKVGDAYNRTRLTPFVRKVLKWWFGWRR
jgi:pyruvate/2-oxoglutarate dehydrogenase complex dihydrolipoamide dehydrogenase (E3) component